MDKESKRIVVKIYIRRENGIFGSCGLYINYHSPFLVTSAWSFPNKLVSDNTTWKFLFFLANQVVLVLFALLYKFYYTSQILKFSQPMMGPSHQLRPFLSIPLLLVLHLVNHKVADVGQLDLQMWTKHAVMLLLCNNKSGSDFFSLFSLH